MCEGDNSWPEVKAHNLIWQGPTVRRASCWSYTRKDIVAATYLTCPARRGLASRSTSEPGKQGNCRIAVQSGTIRIHTHSTFHHYIKLTRPRQPGVIRIHPSRPTLRPQELANRGPMSIGSFLNPAKRVGRYGLCTSPSSNGDLIWPPPSE
jgi:hypothetical protein